MRCGIRHSPAATRIAEPPVLTGIRNHTIQTACIAVKTDKAPRKDPAFSERTKFTFDEFGHIAVTFELPGKECFQMSGNHSVQRVFFGIARTIDLFELHKDIAERKLQRIRATSAPQ
jgi:hypothetical protein